MSRTNKPKAMPAPEAAAQREALHIAHNFASPISLDTCGIENWRMNTRAAVLAPDADAHAMFAWLHGQIREIGDLLWGYINIPNNNTGEKAPELAHHLCLFIEARTVTMLRLLDHACTQTQHDRQGGEA